MGRLVLLGCFTFLAATVLSARTATTTVGAVEGAVAGTFWEDQNGNGQRDTGEPPLRLGRPFYLMSGPERVVASAVPDENGAYQFPPVPAGEYSIRIPAVLGHQWVLTHPRRQFDGEVALPIRVGTDPVEVNIGLFMVSSLPRFSGQARIGETPVEHPVVEAVVRGQVCSFRSGAILPSSFTRAFGVAVASDALISGCGRPGDRIEFRVNGTLARETATWTPGDVGLILTVPSATAPSPSRAGSGTGEPPDRPRTANASLATLTVLFVLAARLVGGRSLHT